MQLLKGRRTDRLDQVITVALLLGALLIALVTWTILGNVLGLLGRFKQPIFLFIVGALLAYLISPLVHLVQRAVKLQWAAIASTYLLLLVALILVGVLLLNPFVSQAQSLVRNLQDPAAASLQRLDAVHAETSGLQTTVRHQQQMVSSGGSISRQTQQHTQDGIRALRRDLTGLSAAGQSRGQIQIPPSYVARVRSPVNQLASAYSTVMRSHGTEERQALAAAVADARDAVSAVNAAYSQAATTPILLLAAQTWLDTLGIDVNLHNLFGNPLQQLSKQVSSILNNALGVATQVGNLLLNTVLALSISVYFVADGGRLVDWLIGLSPARARSRVRSVVSSLNQILGTYLRTQVLLAALAGGLDAAGAMIFGIPYPIVIFCSSFLLSLIPVIGPVILPFPPMIIALVFTPLPTPLFYLPWLLVGEQLATNVIGPRVQGHQEGIHPLEAMAAALLGFPIAGFIGAFFAVPIVSFVHLVVQQVMHSGRHEDVEAGGMAPREGTQIDAREVETT